MVPARSECRRSVSAGAGAPTEMWQQDRSHTMTLLDLNGVKLNASA
jgi:hypothetical protein